MKDTFKNVISFSCVLLGGIVCIKILLWLDRQLDFVYISSEYKIIVYTILYSTAIIYICFVTIKPRK